MANPNPFRQVPPEDDASSSAARSSFHEPSFDVTRSKVDFKEPLITSLPQTFSRFTRRRPITTSKTAIARRQSVATNGKAISILTMLLLALGVVWGGLEFGKTDRNPQRLVRSDKKLNLKRTSQGTDGKQQRRRSLPEKAEEPRQAIAKKSAPSKLALKALPLPVAEALTSTEVAVPEERREEESAKTRFVTSPLLRVRSKAGLDGGIVRVLKAGDRVTVFSEEGSWAKIGDGEYIGKRHLSAAKPIVKVTQNISDNSPEDPRPTSPLPEVKNQEPILKNASEAQPATKHVALQSVKIRAAPGPKRPVVGILRKGQAVSVYEIRGVWARIGENQFVHKGNLRFESTGPAAARSR